jgi:hypothetical protein
MFSTIQTQISAPVTFCPRVNRRRPVHAKLLARLILVLTRRQPKTLAEVKPLRPAL